MKTSKISPLFKSVTIRLTGWFLLIVIVISVTFSIIIYQIATSEIDVRLSRFQTSVQLHNFDPSSILSDPIRQSELKEAQSQLAAELIYFNLIILFVGGFVCYFLAKWHLKPIEDAHEAQSRFTSDASHELRTPLAVMKAEIELVLRSKNSTSHELREVLSSNLEEVDKLSKLSEMLLNLSRLDSDEFEMECVDLGLITSNIIASLNLDEKRVKIDYDKRALAKANETASAEVVKILIDNALKYSNKGSQIKVSIKKFGQSQIVFKIANDGPGITAEKLPHVFDRFFRADDSRTCGGCKGYGLGLALAKKMIELQNGQIFVESTPNKLTTFSFTLPRFTKPQAKTQNQ